MERKAIFPTVSQKAIQNVWRTCFEKSVRNVTDGQKKLQQADIVNDYVMPFSAEALKTMTGLKNMSRQKMDRVSQGMVHACSNYGGDPNLELQAKLVQRHLNSTSRTELSMDCRTPILLLSVQQLAGLTVKHYAQT